MHARDAVKPEKRPMHARDAVKPEEVKLEAVKLEAVEPEEAPLHARDAAKPEKRRTWKAAEDATICQLVELHGQDFETIAALLVGRTADAVRNRWGRLKGSGRLPDSVQGHTYRCTHCGAPKRGHRCVSAVKPSAGTRPPRAPPIASGRRSTRRRGPHPRPTASPTDMSTVTDTSDLISPDLISPDLISPDLISPDLISPDLISSELISPDLISSEAISSEELELISHAEIESEPNTLLRTASTDGTVPSPPMVIDLQELADLMAQ